MIAAEHARLKDHIAQMDGQLDAQIQEGGKHVAGFGLSLVHFCAVFTTLRIWINLVNGRIQSQSRAATAGFPGASAVDA